MSGLEVWLIRASYVLLILFILCVWMFFMKHRYSKVVIGKVLCEFITKEGNGYSRLLPVEGGRIVMPAKKKKDAKSYMIADIATFTIDFPSVPRMFSFMQTKVRKALFDEESWEPLSNRSGKLLLSPVRLYNYGNERFSQIGVRQSLEQERGLSKQSTRGGFSWQWLLIGGILAALAVGGYWVVQNINLFKAATGVG